MRTNFKLTSDLQQYIKDTTLFYLCSGHDLDIPINLFAPTVSDFMFVDKGYFCPGDQCMRSYGWDKSADEQMPLLAKDNHYKFIDKNISGPAKAQLETRIDTNTGDSYPYLEPCILSEAYEHIPSGREIRIHRRRGFGTFYFKNYISSLGVFFYRGDSQGEGGSNDRWLYPNRIRDILNKLCSGGFIVTDGSQHSQWGKSEYKELWKYNNMKGDGEEFVQSTNAFTDKLGNSFKCVGYAGHRYGPTLIWQVIKPF